MLFPLVTPEIVMGVSLLLVFTHLFTFVHTGTLAQILGHVTFSISYVVVIVRGRLFSIGRQYEEAAADLGASPRVALYRVLLPLLTPAIVAGAAITFAISIDDFVISFWLSSGARHRHGPDRQIYCRDPRGTAAVDQRDRHDPGRDHAARRSSLGYLVYRFFTRGERTRAAGHGRRHGGVRHLVDLTRWPAKSHSLIW